MLLAELSVRLAFSVWCESRHAWAVAGSPNACRTSQAEVGVSPIWIACSSVPHHDMRPAGAAADINDKTSAPMLLTHSNMQITMRQKSQRRGHRGAKTSPLGTGGRDTQEARTGPTSSGAG